MNNGCLERRETQKPKAEEITMIKKIAVVALVGLLLQVSWLPVPTGGLSVANDDQLMPVDVRSAEIRDEALPADANTRAARVTGA